MKIVYCIDSICHPGGLAVTTLTKVNYLSEDPCNEVWLAVTDMLEQGPVIPLSEKAHLVDLGIGYYDDDWRSRWHTLKACFLKRLVHAKRLKRLLASVAPDVVIATGTSEKHFLPFIKVVSKPHFIREIHFTSNYRSLSARDPFEKTLAKIGDFFDFRVCITKYDRIVLLSEEDRRRNWKQENDKLIVIPDSLFRIPAKYANLDQKTVLAVGRLVRQKNFTSLIRAWRRVSATCPDWNLKIWGDGEQRAELERLIGEYGLNASIHLMGYSDDILSKYLEGSVFVLSSLFEGFGMVIVEAMSCGLPVVSYACPCGPSDIIREGMDGFLVPPGDEDALAERIIRLIRDRDLRIRMGASARERSEDYHPRIVMAQWDELFKLA